MREPEIVELEVDQLDLGGGRFLRPFSMIEDEIERVRPERTAMMTRTTRSSMRVKAVGRRGGGPSGRERGVRSGGRGV